ncbi:hypothetical protein [Formosa algae]|uniref:hypothetical protein n=1 Tax=Formosa algae TaxID=225843 RepID=UPI0026A353B8|nr:hypothetical protein [Formosa algae]
MQTAWKDFVSVIEAEGKHNLASILSIDTPKLKDKTTISVVYPNQTNKIEVERSQFHLMSFIRKRLNNFEVSLEIEINEEKEKQYAYTPREKFEKMCEKNPSLDLLRKNFRSRCIKYYIITFYSFQFHSL